ncbi:hypothetical protein F5Y15DRAFT_138103 [Xylariaceae sp. FL0016]|nr:hypothetical protein F5Y15DRAFT_138103 [Xylariaceae sp. FL0016]
MGIASGIGHLFQSVIEVIQGIFASIVHFFQFILNSIIGLFQSFVHFVEHTLGFAIRESFSDPISAISPRLLPLSENRQQRICGRGQKQEKKLLIQVSDNFFILGTIAAAVFGYMLYTQRQGTAPVSRTMKTK